MSEPIADMLRQRDAALAEGAPAASDAVRPAPLWGLALSGGGIRSATFCFGLLVALARHRALLRFQLLSTVSGGGFIGALLGRLFHRAGSLRGGAAKVQAALADADRRWFTWWLRANGNYLFARGARDTFMAAAIMLRNLIALHIELALLAVVLGTLLATLDIGVWRLVDALWDPLAQGDGADALQRAIRRLPSWLPTLWLLLLPLVAAGGVLVCAYWSMPARLNGTVDHALAIAPWLASLASAWALWHWRGLLTSDDGFGVSRSLLWAAMAMAWLWALGIPLGWWMRWRHREQEDRARNALTRGNGHLLRAGLVVAGLGVLDRLAWFMAFEMKALLGTGAWLLLAAAILRVLLPALGGSSGKAPAWIGGRLLTLAHVAGLLLTALLAAWWMACIDRQVFDSVFVAGQQTLHFRSGLLTASLFAACALSFLFVTGHDVGFANLSSLHRFYKARLVRGWLGAANSERFPMVPRDAAGDELGARTLAQREDEPAAGYELQVEVDDVHARDDVPLNDYAPQAGGGPVHLVNVCLNHTERGKGPFNADRKGMGLTLAPGGWLRIGERPWQPLPAGADAQTLGAWTAISGAAFAPGLGTMTRSGIAALAMFAGVRLGYWWDARALLGQPAGLAWFAKSRLLLRELLGRFGGDRDRFWYLSDGGHFENTAAYALLRERARLIVLADCGADPDYRFGDLENLVRKARVDLGAVIHFLKPDMVVADADWRRFGSVSDLASPASDACMALAVVSYRDGSTGWLVLVKPNMFSGLPVDLINFKNEHPDFPQQSTADQSFDEAQWESYFMLGRSIGANLPLSLLQRVADGEAQAFFKPDDGRALAVAPSGEPVRSLRARLATGAVGASIGLTTAATLGVSVWQGIDAWRGAAAKANEADDKALKELTDLWGRLKPVAAAASAVAPAELASRAANAGALSASLLRIADTLCPSGFDRWFRDGQTAWVVLGDARGACRDLKDGAPDATPQACTRLLSIDDRENCLYPEDQAGARADARYRHCPPRYWGRDYALGPVVGNCPREAATVDAGPSPPAGASSPDVAAAAQSEAAAKAAAVVKARLAADAASKAMAQAAAASAAAAALPAPSAAALPAGGGLSDCGGRRIYVQVYGRGRDLDEAALRAELLRSGASVPRTEDMNASAALARRAPPTPVRLDTLRWHTADDQPCAEALGRWMARQTTSRAEAPRIEPLPAHLKPNPRVVEVWLAPPAMAGAK